MKKADTEAIAKMLNEWPAIGITNVRHVTEAVEELLALREAMTKVTMWVNLNAGVHAPTPRTWDRLWRGLAKISVSTDYDK